MSLGNSYFSPKIGTVIVAPYEGEKSSTTKVGGFMVSASPDELVPLKVLCESIFCVAGDSFIPAKVDDTVWVKKNYALGLLTYEVEGTKFCVADVQHVVLGSAKQSGDNA